MRIGIEGQRLFRSKKHGMDFVALRMIKKLQEIDRENQYCIFVRPGEDDTCLQETENFKIVEVPASSYPSWEQIALPRAVKRHRIDILHCTSNTAPLFLSVPVILTLHDIIYLEAKRGTSKQTSLYQRFGNLYRKWIVPKIAGSCSTIITVSNFEKEQIEKRLKLSDSKVKVVYNGVGENFRPEFDDQKLAEIRAGYGLPDDFILFLGNTDPKKNLQGVLKAYARYCSQAESILPLAIVDLAPETLAAVLKEIGHSELAENIKLLGYVQNSDLPAIYSLCRLFLYPSLRESFGLPIVEAMACGAPVITSNTSSMPEIADDAAMLVDPMDPGQIAQAISLLLNDENAREAQIASGYRRAARFSWTETAEQALHIYNDHQKQNEIHEALQKSPVQSAVYN